ncbi:MAG: hypothetical protein Q9M40_01430 [Sulfurimonas sp.]|nr:hypothetical protein [Sulfurimonas sp.]
MTPELIPSQDELSDQVELYLTDKGGHVGFVQGKFFKPEYWLEKKIVSFLSN